MHCRTSYFIKLLTTISNYVIITNESIRKVFTAGVRDECRRKNAHLMTRILLLSSCNWSERIRPIMYKFDRRKKYLEQWVKVWIFWILLISLSFFHRRRWVESFKSFKSSAIHFRNINKEIVTRWMYVWIYYLGC